MKNGGLSHVSKREGDGRVSLHTIMLYTGNAGTVERQRRIGAEGSLRVLRETDNCWYLEEPPSGIPHKCLKSRAYRLQSNQSGIYMFGLDEKLLTDTWNEAVAVPES